MKINSKKLSWLTTIGLAIGLSISSFSTQAASREDVIIGVIAGAAVGYALSEHDSRINVAYHKDYRKGHHHKYARHQYDHGHRDHHHHKKHHGKYCDHKSHRARYSHSDRHSDYKSRWSNNHHDKKHHRDYSKKRQYYSSRDYYPRAYRH